MTQDKGQVPEALFYASALENCAEVDFDHIFVPAAGIIRRLHAQVAALTAAPGVQTNTKTHDLLSTMIGLFLGAKEKIGYQPGSAIDKTVAEAVEHLKDWPYPETAPTAQPAPADRDEGISREQWINQAVRAYLIAGDTEDQALECAKALCREQNWDPLQDDLADPYDAAMSDIEGRGPAPAAGAVAGPTREQIRDVFLANGFTVKEGQTDLKPYVYAAAEALLALAASTTPPAQAADSVLEDAALLHYALADGGNQSMNWQDVYDDWNGEGYFIDALRAAYKQDAALAQKEGGK